MIYLRKACPTWLSINCKGKDRTENYKRPALPTTAK